MKFGQVILGAGNYFNVPVRDWLAQQGFTNVSWDNKNKVVLVNGKPFLYMTDPNTGAPLFIIKDGRAYSNTQVLMNAIKQNLLNNPTPAKPQPGINPPKSPFGQAVAESANPFASGPSNEPGAGPGTEDLTTAQSAQPIAEAQQNGTIPITGSQYQEPASTVQAQDVGVNTWGPDNTFNLQERINENTLKAQADSYEKLLQQLQQPNPIAQKINELWGMRLQNALDDLQTQFNTQKQALEAQKGYVKAQHEGEIQAIDRAIQKARQRSKEDMNARGLYFSGLLTKALNSIEEAGLSEKAKALARETAALDDIAGKIAVLTSNYAISKNKVQNLVNAEKALQLLKVAEQDQQKKDQINAALAGIDAQLNALKVSRADREKLWNLQQKQAQQEAEQKQAQQDFENWLATQKLNLQYQNADLNTRKEMFNEWLNTQNLSLKQKEQALNEWYKEQLIKNAQQQESDTMKRFYDTLNYNYQRLNADQAYRQARLALQQQGIADVPTALGDIFAQGYKGLSTYLSKYQQIAQDGELNDAVKQAANNTITLLSTAQKVADETRTTDNPQKIGEDLGLFIRQLDPASATTFVDKFIGNPYVKAVGHLLIVANGDGGTAMAIYKKERENFIKQYGLNPEQADDFILTALKAVPLPVLSYGDESIGGG
jgi:hypothetical protein